MKKENINPYSKKVEGIIKKITKQNALVQKEQVRFYPKYERFTKRTVKIHARIPKELMDKIKVGQIVTIAECRPLSKTVRHIVIGSKTNVDEINKKHKIK